MCRMMAIRSADPEVRADALRAFRTLAGGSSRGPPAVRTHRDGWGMAGLQGRALAHSGRSPQDATRDAGYDEAVARASGPSTGSLVIAHVRNASRGIARLENSHPFVRDGWAFCHNGTVRGIEAPQGLEPEGDTDSERFFLRILAGMHQGASVEETLRSAIDHAASLPHTSLTFLLTNGRGLWAYRRVGPDPGSCGTHEAACAYYALGWGTWRGATVVVQEPEFLGGIEGWRELPDGALLHLGPDGEIRVLDPFGSPERGLAAAGAGAGIPR